MRVAICISGAMSKTSGRFLNPQDIYNNSSYINFNICYNSIVKHIIQANPDYNFDFFIHSWNKDLQQDLVNLYNPKSYLFEDAHDYDQEIFPKMHSNEDFGGISKSISLKKSIELLQEYIINNNVNYDLVLVYRPDLFLCKDIILKNYDLNKIYVNKHGESQGDFHFIMNVANSLVFKNLYNSINSGNLHRTHFWIKNYVNKFMHQDLIEDDIVAGKDQEVLRKVYENNNSYINIEMLKQYGE